jgi:hypothetical protein
MSVHTGTWYWCRKVLTGLINRTVAAGFQSLDRRGQVLAGTAMTT